MSENVARLALIYDIWRATRGGPRAIAERQRRRLAETIAFARTHSAFYRERFANLPSEIDDIRELPPLPREELMARFDDVVTDPAVTRSGVEAFVADKTLVGQPYLGRYLVCTSSGVTGHPGIFLQDEQAQAIYGALTGVRGFLRWLGLADLWAIRRKGGRVAAVIATGGHYAGAAWAGQAIGQRGRRSGFYRARTFSVLMPIPELVRELNEFQPAALVGYSTALALLLEEQIAGRLRIDPVVIVTAAEWLPPVTRERLRVAFHCKVHDLYAASEFLGIAFDCEHGWLHVNCDWLVLEPVDGDGQPVLPGQPSHTVLLTNLANRVQLLIRYDLGDSITVNPDPCACGSSLPAIRVEGRRDEILYLLKPDGRTVAVLPAALATLVEETPGVRRCQVIQVAPATLRVRLEAAPGANTGQVWDEVERNLKEYLARIGIAAAEIERAAEAPGRDALTGKFREIWASRE